MPQVGDRSFLTCRLRLLDGGPLFPADLHARASVFFPRLLFSLYSLSLYPLLVRHEPPSVSQPASPPTSDAADPSRPVPTLRKRKTKSSTPAGRPDLQAYSPQVFKPTAARLEIPKSPLGLAPLPLSRRPMCSTSALCTARPRRVKLPAMIRIIWSYTWRRLWGSR